MKITKKKHTYEEVKNFFATMGCLLLTTHYTWNREPLSYICICDRVSTIQFRHFKEGVRCKHCGIEKSKYRVAANCLKRYGVKTHSQREDVKQRAKENLKVSTEQEKEKRKNNRKSTLLKKYGVDHMSKIPGVRDKANQTIMEKYGVPGAHYLSNSYSKESQKLFVALQQRLPDKVANKSYFAKLNQEFVIGSKYTQCFKYDFVNSYLKKAIEYNGYNFHPREDQDENEVGWKAFHPKETVKEAREYEKTKYRALEDRGYKILTVWDYELRKDFESLVQKCLKFLGVYDYA